MLPHSVGCDAPCAMPPTRSTPRSTRGIILIVGHHSTGLRIPRCWSSLDRSDALCGYQPVLLYVDLVGLICLFLFFFFFLHFAKWSIVSTWLIGHCSISYEFLFFKAFLKHWNSLSCPWNEISYLDNNEDIQRSFLCTRQQRQYNIVKKSESTCGVKRTIIPDFLSTSNSLNIWNDV